MADKLATPTDPFTPDFDTVVEGLLQEFHVPGLSIAVVHGEETFVKGYGYSRTEPPQHMTSQSLLGVASTTKAFVSMALAQIVYGELSQKDAAISSGEKISSSQPITWQTPVSMLLPGDFVLPSRELTEAVTIEDILSHRSGLPSCDNASLSWGAGDHADTPAITTRKLRHFPLPSNTALATLRTRFIYSNTMYAAAQHLIETLSDQPLSQVLKERIFDVLGMRHSFFGFYDIEARGKNAKAYSAAGYRWVPDKDDGGKGKYVEVPWRGSPEQGGAGDIVSCVSDYALWMRAVISRDSRLVSEKGWKEVIRPRISLDDDENPPEQSEGFGTRTYALGWEVDSYWGEKIVSHTGGDPGIGTLVHLLPKQKYGVAIFANTSDAHNIERIISMHLTDNLLDVPATKRFDWVKLARDETAKEENDKIKENFAAKARKLFSEDREEEGYDEKRAIEGGKGEEAKEEDEEPVIKVDFGLPLSSCLGRYRHPAYGVIEVQTTKLGQIRKQRGQPPAITEAEDDLQEVLFVAMHDRTFPAELVFLHHNASFFVIEEWDVLDHKVVDWLRGEIRIGARGEVTGVGIGFAADDGVEESLSFERVVES